MHKTFTKHSDEYTSDGRLKATHIRQKPKSAFYTPFADHDIYFITPEPTSMKEAFCLFWRNYFKFSGYSNRAEYWWWCLWDTLINVFLWLTIIPTALMNIAATLMAGGDLNDGALDITNGPLNLMYSLKNIGFAGIVLIIWIVIKIIPTLALKTRRLHDAGVSNAWIAILLACEFIPLISLLAKVAEILFALVPSIRRKSTTRH